MFFTKKPLDLPTAETALPGRAHSIPTAESHFVNGRPLKGPYPEGLETAIFAMGCFWGVERMFWKIPGSWLKASSIRKELSTIPKSSFLSGAAKAPGR